MIFRFCLFEMVVAIQVTKIYKFDCVLREHKKTKHVKKKNLNYLDELNSTARFSLYHLRTLADIFFS